MHTVTDQVIALQITASQALAWWVCMKVHTVMQKDQSVPSFLNLTCAPLQPPHCAGATCQALQA
eukprot:scaffold176509_cov24-Tisochrysis_lutea.AAC.1